MSSSRLRLAELSERVAELAASIHSAVHTDYHDTAKMKAAGQRCKRETGELRKATRELVEMLRESA